MPKFTIKSPFAPSGDQQKAIEKLSFGVNSGAPHQTLLGVTGSGKTFTVANVIAQTQKPALVISHNKTLAFQLYQEFKEFMPENSVHYFVSYYDYYQPEAYIPQTDTYIDKDVKINEQLDRLRHEATQAVLTRNDAVVVASVSCIYNIGSPENYQKMSLQISCGQTIAQKEFLKHLVSLQYQRNEMEKIPGTFQAKGEIVQVISPNGKEIARLVWEGQKIVRIMTAEDFLQPQWSPQREIKIFPAKYWVSEAKALPAALVNIENELHNRLKILKEQNKLLEAQRIEQRTRFDMEMLKSTGYCHGIENYSRHMEFREPDSPPFTLLDYFRHAYGNDFLTVIDESHMTIPQIRGMYHGDRSRKETLIEYGFRLPSALDNRPLRFKEFEQRTPQTIYMSATPEVYELEKSGKEIVEQIVRPTGLLDPKISVRKSENQIQDLTVEIKLRIKKDQRVLVTVLTKRMAEDLADFLKEKDIRVQYLHSEIKTLERSKILTGLRTGEYQVIVGVNLLREGLDLPEVALVAILDADKEGFLRNRTSLIQTIGRAARHIEGTAIMYADHITKSIKTAIEETERRRKIQEEYNKNHDITPRQIQKAIRQELVSKEKKEAELEKELTMIPMGLLAETRDIKKIIANYQKEIKKAVKELDFQKAQRLKDIVAKIIKGKAVK